MKSSFYKLMILGGIVLGCIIYSGFHVSICLGHDESSSSSPSCPRQARAGIPEWPPESRLAVDDPVRSGRDSLNRWMSYPWYDSVNDDLKRVDIPKPTATTGSGAAFNFNLGTIVQWFAWTALAVAAILLLYFGMKYLLNRETSAAAAETQETGAAAGDRIEALPMPIEIGKLNLLEEARRLYEQGNYSLAVVFLFGYQLVELDRRHYIRLSKGKTNRQYLREIGARSATRQLIEQTMVAFEDAFFGRRTLDRTRFESCWFRLAEFEKLNAE